MIDTYTGNMPFAAQGWQCPICRTVWSPSIFSCACSRAQIKTAAETGIPPEHEKYMFKSNVRAEGDE